MASNLNDVPRLFGLTIASPCFHKLTALLQRVAPSVGLFGLIAYDVSQSGLSDFAREVGDVTRPEERTCRTACFMSTRPTVAAMSA